MKKSYFIGIFLGIWLFFGAIFAVFAQTNNTIAALPTAQLIESLEAQITSLQAKISELKAQIAELKAKQIKTDAADLKEILKELKENLKEGMTSEDIKLLQEFLATDKDIYPEGVVTGYFGRLTAAAVKRFQARHGIEQVGIVGPQTRKMVNSILGTASAGKSGKIPPGILKNFSGEISGAPASTSPTLPAAVKGEKKIVICHIPPGNPKAKNTLEIAKAALNAHLLHGDTLGSCGKTDENGGTSTTTPDTTAPVISNLSSQNIGSTSAQIIWSTNENATGKVWYNTATVDINSTTTPALTISSLSLSHSFSLLNLTASTTYYFIVSSTDAASNVSTSTIHNFATSAQ